MTDRAWDGLSKAVAEGGQAAETLPPTFIDEAIRDLRLAAPADLAELEQLYAMPAREPERS